METQADILKERDDWVLVNKGKEESLAAAESRFWKANPDAKRRSRNAAPDANPDSDTLDETVRKRLERWANDQVAASGVRPKSLEGRESTVFAKVRYWDTSDGQALRDLLRAHGNRPLDKIEKTAAHADGWAAFDKLA